MMEISKCKECGHNAVWCKDDIGLYVRCIVDFCDNCTEYFDSPEEAIAAWNERQKGGYQGYHAKDEGEHDQT